ncbi:MAG: hypothetical protein IKZ43_04550 [Acidaminococcaceae bacterium]|nr:hypothetical protein [Acidaminococcaceae bacterium]
MTNRRNQTAVSDEEIVSALLQSGSIAQAATLTGIGQRTLYDRMGTREFKAAYSAAKSDIVRSAVLAMNRNLSAAVDAVTGIMNDEENPAGIRLQAAKMIIENAAKFSERLAAADEQTAKMAAPNPFEALEW